MNTGLLKQHAQTLRKQWLGAAALPPNSAAAHQRVVSLAFFGGVLCSGLPDASVSQSNGSGIVSYLLLKVFLHVAVYRNLLSSNPPLANMRHTLLI